MCRRLARERAHRAAVEAAHVEKTRAGVEVVAGADTQPGCRAGFDGHAGLVLAQAENHFGMRTRHRCDGHLGPDARLETQLFEERQKQLERQPIEVVARPAGDRCHVAGDREPAACGSVGMGRQVGDHAEALEGVGRSCARAVTPAQACAKPVARMPRIRLSRPLTSTHRARAGCRCHLRSGWPY